MSGRVQRANAVALADADSKARATCINLHGWWTCVTPSPRGVHRIAALSTLVRACGRPSRATMVKLAIEGGFIALWVHGH